MRIEPSEEIAGLPIVRVRDLLRRLMNRYFTVETIRGRTDLDPDQIARLVEELDELGYLESSEGRGEEDIWELSVDGRRFARATAARPVKRQTAERALKEFLGRVEELNADDHYLYRCERVVLFGSYLDADAVRLSDVDVAIELKPRYEGEEFQQRSRERIDGALDSGRRFSNLTEKLGWPETEVLLFLKSGSRVISLGDTRDRVLEDAEQREIYRFDGDPDGGGT